MTVLLFADKPSEWDRWEPHLRQSLKARSLNDVELTTDISRSDVDAIAYAPSSGLTDFTAYPNLRAIFSMWAGVERIVGNPSITVPLTRMVEPGLTIGMAEWVLGHVMRHHLGMDIHLYGQDGTWRNAPGPPLAKDRTVGILGLGTLGLAAAERLISVGFNVVGWSRRPRSVEGVRCLSGDDGLKETLESAEILVLLLPKTVETINLLNADRLRTMRPGAFLINPGRGTLIDDTALLAALETGHIKHATLDVFREEPLPTDHPYWAHPNVTVTPHIAAETRPETASEVIAENLQRLLAREPLLYEVDRTAGY